MTATHRPAGLLVRTLSSLTPANLIALLVRGISR